MPRVGRRAVLNGGVALRKEASSNLAIPSPPALLKAYHRAVGRLLALLLILALPLAACGKGEYISPAEKRLAVALSRCGLNRAESVQETDRASAELHSLVKADRKLPRVARLIADAHASNMLRTTLETLVKAGGARSPGAKGDIAKLYHSQVKFYEEEKALGVRCIGRPKVYKR